MAIGKQENAHPEVAILVTRDFNAGKLKSVLPNFYQHIKCATRGKKNSRPLLVHTQRHLAKLPAYKLNLQQEVPVTRSKRK
jgi:hypothetical protein